ncbi:hypothetical protein [Ralstonia flaminis]|jgi:hypothetical protein|uniref:Saccharopine dehydrogenase NADP binding domain-containing protein n=1 Tax=Ralstonia flaminis TaxID=3058597 RepID=A0ABM9KA21_9RALS|nr:hypothetical protein [Ralstonia sp. LMG 18101]CAJ0818798.1 hypothetical protein LMG18101_03739 [Ralstonia sp. LMG 18101]
MVAPLRAAHVVVIGGYGFFGQRLVERLSVHASLTVTIAGRSLTQAQALTALVRAGIVNDWSRHTRWLKAVSDWFLHWGSDVGGMHLRVEGGDADGTLHSRLWHLLAVRGDGPYVPTLAAAALVRRLLEGKLPQCGAMPCVGLLTLDDFARETDGLAITMREARA